MAYEKEGFPVACMLERNHHQSIFYHHEMNRAGENGANPLFLLWIGVKLGTDGNTLGGIASAAFRGSFFSLFVFWLYIHMRTTGWNLREGSELKAVPKLK